MPRECLSLQPRSGRKLLVQDFQVNTDGKDLFVSSCSDQGTGSGFSHQCSCRAAYVVRWMNITGKNGLACITPLSAVVKNNKLVTSAAGLPVIRDLAVDMSIFAQYEKVRPYSRTIRCHRL